MSIELPCTLPAGASSPARPQGGVGHSPLFDIDVANFEDQGG
jgi:hypothetical protein